MEHDMINAAHGCGVCDISCNICSPFHFLLLSLSHMAFFASVSSSFPTSFSMLLRFPLPACLLLRLTRSWGKSLSTLCSDGTREDHHLVHNGCCHATCRNTVRSFKIAYGVTRKERTTVQSFVLAPLSARPILVFVLVLDAQMSSYFSPPSCLCSHFILMHFPCIRSPV